MTKLIINSKSRSTIYGGISRTIWRYMHWPHLCWISCTFLSIARHKTFFKERRKSVSQILTLLVTSHGCEQFPKFHSTPQIRAKMRPSMIFPLISMLWMLALEAKSLPYHPSIPSKGLSLKKCWIDIWKVWFSTNLLILVQKAAWALLFQLPPGLL